MRKVGVHEADDQMVASTSRESSVQTCANSVFGSASAPIY